jgi:hypothetical protein
MLLHGKHEYDSDDEGDQAPFLDEQRYYPTMLPFRHASDAHDQNALAKPSLPQDLAEQEVCFSICRQRSQLPCNTWQLWR